MYVIPIKFSVSSVTTQNVGSDDLIRRNVCVCVCVLVQRSLSQREHRQRPERQQLTPHIGPHVELCGSHGHL